MTIFIRLVALALWFFAALFASGNIPQAFAELPVRGFYMPSYGVNDLVHATNDGQLESFRAQVQARRMPCWPCMSEAGFHRSSAAPEVVEEGFSGCFEA